MTKDTVLFCAKTSGWYPSGLPVGAAGLACVEVPYEEYRLLLGQQITSNEDGYPILLTHQVLTPTSTQLCFSIDQAADAARRAVVADPTRTEEYKLAVAEAQAFKTTGYPANAIPRTVAAWAIGGRTARQAADNILVESAAYTEALYQIREARLGAKEMVRQAMAAGEVDQAQDITAETIAAIESAISGIGNVRG